MMAEREEEIKKGPIAWMARNAVAANLLMVVLILGGLIMASRIQQEVFPDIQLDIVSVVVPYPGATPEDVEQGIVLAVEEAIRGLDGVEEIRSVAAEGEARISAELLRDAEPIQVFNDIKSEVDGITSFPRDAEEPIVSLASERREVIALILYGDLDAHQLRDVSETVRDELLGLPNISVVEVEGLPPPEISIEVSQENLRRYGLTLEDIARRVRLASADLPGGSIETRRGELLLRTTERRDYGDEFRKLTIIADAEGARVQLGDIANVIDGFRDVDRRAWYNGMPGVRLRVFRVGDQKPLDVAQSVRQYVRSGGSVPENVRMAVWNDMSEIFSDRIGLLIKNGLFGLVLVLCILGIFLRPSLAFWVTLGIPISFLGTFLFLPMIGVSINMISLFAFLLALGIVVDDAIVIGEAGFHQRREGLDPEKAAIVGAREVAAPVVFAVLTTLLAFVPMLFVPGTMGKFMINVPQVVIPIFLLSLVESLFILPAHIRHVKEVNSNSRIMQAQQRFSDKLEDGIDRWYGPAIERILHWRYLTLALAAVVLIISVSYAASGRLPFHFMPDIEGDVVTATVELPYGSAAASTRRIAVQMEETAIEVLDEMGGGTDLRHGIFTTLGSSGLGGERREAGGHVAQIAVELVPAEDRTVSAREFSRRWRERVGEIPGVDRLDYAYSVGPSRGGAVAIELAHRDIDTLESAAERLGRRMSEYDGVFDVDDGFRRGKPQVNLRLKPGARALGVTERGLGRQVRSAFFGAEALRQQRGRFELRVYVRQPDSFPQSPLQIENLLIHTPGGRQIPLHQAAWVERSSSPTEIEREGGRRVVDVTADVDPTVTSGGKVTADLVADVIPELIADFPGLGYELSGQQQDRNESLNALGQGMAVAFLAMYALMAIAFRSYVQPVVILISIPFGFVGAVVGHLIVGFDLSIVSVFGLVALSGVVVNDALVLIASVNDFRRSGKTAHDALIAAAKRRFRPILLTSMTTFFGLAPMIFETSIQARFLIPMAISLGFGVLFVTFIVLILVPVLYLILEDLQDALARDTSSTQQP